MKTGPFREEMHGSLGSQKLHGYAEEEISRRSLSCLFNLKCHQLKLTFYHFQHPTFLTPNYSKALCVCVPCVHVCACALVCVCVHVLTCIHACTGAHVCMRVFMCGHVLVCVLMCVCACVCVCTCTHACVCVRVFMCMCSCVLCLEAKEQTQVSFLVAFNLFLFSLRQLISLELTNQLGWRTSEP